MDAPIKVTHHNPLKFLVFLLVSAYIYLLIEGFVLSTAPSWSHWGLLFVGGPIFLFIIGATYFTYIEISTEGITKKWGFNAWSRSLTFISWKDITLVSPYTEVFSTTRRAYKSNQTGIKFLSKTGSCIRIPDSMDGAEEALQFTTTQIPREHLDSEIIRKLDLQ